MTMNTDDDLDAALRQWGDGHRRAAPDTAPPSIADLLAERGRNRARGAVAATVVLVAALAVGLGVGLRPASSPDASPRPSATRPAATAATAAGSCARRFADAGSRIDPSTGRGVVVLRYTGTTACRVVEQPQLALVNAEGHVAGPHGAPRTLNPFRSVRPGATVYFPMTGFANCVSLPGGTYSLAVFLRPTATARPDGGVRVPFGTVAPPSGSTAACASLVPINSGRVQPDTGSAAVPLAALTRIARNEAAADGDSSATAEAVRTTYGRVEKAILGTPMSRSRANPVWVVQLHGTFVCGSCSRPAGADAPRGRSVLLVLQEPGLSYSDSVIGRRSHDLAELGDVVPLVP